MFSDSALSLLVCVQYGYNTRDHLACLSVVLARQWISQYPTVFEADPRLEHVMGDLWTLVRSEVENTRSQFIHSSCL